MGRNESSEDVWGKGIEHKNITVPSPLRDGDIPGINRSSAILWPNRGEMPKINIFKSIFGE